MSGSPAPDSLCVGIDVGAPRKGYHAVALRGRALVGTRHARDPHAVAQWCRQHGAVAVAVDAPCRWRPADGPARAAEVALARARIACFSTPTEEKARGHAFYTWMFAGQALYAALAPHYPLYPGPAAPGYARHPPGMPPQRIAFETYPHAIACALAAQHGPARGKLAARTALLRRAGIDAEALPGIDLIDAALCAYTAQSFAAGRCQAYGDVAGGFILVPADRLAPGVPEA